MNDKDVFEYNNEEEAEMAQLHSIHLHLNAIEAVRAKMPKGPSLEECEECGDPIPKERQEAVKGVTMCIYCQERSEKLKRLKGNPQ
jgi:phage/conjugal plasmid C-4 type zinc finger TraR family protein